MESIYGGSLGVNPNFIAASLLKTPQHDSVTADDLTKELKGGGRAAWSSFTMAEKLKLSAAYGSIENFIEYYKNKTGIDLSINTKVNDPLSRVTREQMMGQVGGSVLLSSGTPIKSILYRGSKTQQKKSRSIKRTRKARTRKHRGHRK